MSKSEIEKIKAVLSEINEARNKATNGDWYVDLKDAPNGPCGIESESDAHSWICEPSEFDSRPRFNDSQFIAIAANKITRLTKALEIAVEALEQLKNITTNYKVEGGVYNPKLGSFQYNDIFKHENNISIQSLKQISEILEAK